VLRTTRCRPRASQKRYGVDPNLLVFPPQLLLYMALAPEEKLLYDKGGPNAAAMFEAGVEGFKTRQYRGMGVVTSDPVRSCCRSLCRSLCRSPS
jgi:hypothetical protein